MRGYFRSPFGQARPGPSAPVQPLTQGPPAVAPEPYGTEQLLEHIQDLADLATAGKPADRFDYTMDSLRYVDEHLQALDGEDLGLIAQLIKGYSLNWGAYIGEVLRRTYGGHWLSPFQIALSTTAGHDLVMTPGPEDSLWVLWESFQLCIVASEDPPAEVPPAEDR